MASIPLPSYLTKKDIQALMEACIRFYAIELLGEGYQGYPVTSWQIPHLGYKWKSSLDFFKDISQITSQDNIKKAYDVLAGWEKEAPDVLSVPIEIQEVSETVPRNLNELVEALEKAKSQEEKSALIRNYQAFKAAAPVTPVAPVAEAAVAEGVGIKVTPEALKFFEQSLAKTTEAPFRLVSFFSSPKFLAETPQAKKSLGSAISLARIARRAEGLPASEKRRLLEFVENLRQAEFSFFAQTKLSRRIFSVQEITVLMGPEVGLGQGQMATLIQGGAPPGKRPSLLGRLFGGVARRAITKTATKAVTSALTKAGISITTKAAAGAVGQAVVPIPGVGAVVGLVVGWLIDKAKDLFSWFKRNAPKVAIGLGALLFGTGFVLQSSVLMGAGGVIGAGGLISQAGGVGSALSNAATGISSLLTGILSLTIASIATPLIVALISIPIIVAIILFIINSGAYIVPPFTAGGEIPTECQGEGPPKPEAKDVLFSSDGQYAYPLAPSSQVGEDCTHWDKTLATDIFPIGGNGVHTPVIAYTNGVVHETSTTDPKGGKYIILRGNDGRYYYYAHNCALYVRPGQGVSVGEVIATTDRTGSAAQTPEHVHFAISNFPRFQEGGTICPSEDFADKFSSYNRCSPERRCVP